ncbi:MAG: histidinol dehydrogenase [Desulfomicrobium sp.]|nr:histidinol dehydrogenase [Desulfomicrobium sp.]
MPIRTIHISNALDFSRLTTQLALRSTAENTVESRVAEILSQVQSRGDEALLDYTQSFDCPDFTVGQLKVSPQDIAQAYAQIPASDAAIIREAAANIRAFHQRQKQNSWFLPEGNAVLGQLVLPVDRAGLYVPGGQGGETPLISSLLMNAIPAQVAGVPSLCMVTPPRKDGTVNPYILATAAILGIEEIYLCGSAWAIGALTYGTKTIAKVDCIAGPGNIYVATAKRLVTGQVGIDMIAGPSEIAILADTSAQASWLAADMLSQAEHDPLASSILICPDASLLQAVHGELARQLELLPRHEAAVRSLTDWGALVQVPNLDLGMDLINALAPEHVELCVQDPWSFVGQIRNAGAVFLGHSSPEPVGDYFAGPNHVLPTLSTARFSSALSVDTFCKKTSIICTNQSYIQAHGAKIARLARLEGLEAHAKSVEYRLEDIP